MNLAFISNEYPDFKTKNEIPYYVGELNIGDFSNWIKLVDNFLEYMKILEEKQVKMVINKLKGTASA